MFTLTFDDGMQFTLTAEQAANLVNERGVQKVWTKYEQSVLDVEECSIVCPRGADWRDMIYQKGGPWIA